MIKLYTDAATLGNPGPTGLGALIVSPEKNLQLKQTLNSASNHEGEFAAAIAGFKAAKEQFTADETILFYTDSRLVSDAVGKGFAKHYEVQLAELLALIDIFNFVVTKWIPEKQNQGAHNLANQALHANES